MKYSFIPVGSYFAKIFFIILISALIYFIFIAPIPYFVIRIILCIWIFPFLFLLIKRSGWYVFYSIDRWEINLDFIEDVLCINYKCLKNYPVIPKKVKKVYYVHKNWLDKEVLFFQTKTFIPLKVLITKKTIGDNNDFEKVKIYLIENFSQIKEYDTKNWDDFYFFGRKIRPKYGNTLPDEL